MVDIHRTHRMRRLGIAVVVFLILSTVAFLAVEKSGAVLLTDPRAAMQPNRATAALVGMGLLTADVLIPVPASIVMLANGAIFGLAAGAALSFAGGFAASLAGWWLGRSGRRWVERSMSPEERERASALIRKWGPLAVLASRPIPMLAESVSLSAGAAGMRPAPYLLACAAGLVPCALIYAAAGSRAANLHAGLLSFACVMGLSALLWLIGRRRS